MDDHGVYLWVAMCAVGPKVMVGHRNGPWGGTGGRCDSGLGHAVYVKYTRVIIT